MQLQNAQIVFLLAGSYLTGSIPSAYFIGRWLKGIDIRQYGTGNVGGSNVFNSVSKWAVIPVAIFDIGKAAVPAWLALYPLDLGYGVAIAAGMAAAVGHAWSPFLNFTGGRALSCIFGTLIVVFPQGALFMVAILVLGFIFKKDFATTLALLIQPVLSVLYDMPTAVTWGTIAMILFTAVKRLEANRTPLPEGSDRSSVMWRRLWLDRDVADVKKWRYRKPFADNVDEGKP